MIRSERLCAGYDGAETLHDIGFTAPDGKLTALIGPNGSGKSTLLKACAGILKPTSGSVSVEGQDIRDLAPRALAKLLAYMPQSRPVPEMTVQQLTAHGRYPHLKWGRSLSETDRAIIRRSLEMTGTLPIQNKRLDRISGGERQRAYLSMMLAQEAPVMLLDEPAAYLDLKAQFDMLALLRQLAEAGRTILIVMHDLPLALDCCDHIILMDAGRVAASGTPDEVLSTGLIGRVFDIRIDNGGLRFRPAGKG